MAKISATLVGKPLRKATLALTAVALLATGCNNGDGTGVEIEYRQVAHFPAYELPGQLTRDPGPTGMFVLYRLNSVRNNSDAAFDLDPNRLAAVHDDNSSREHAAHEPALLGNRLLETVTVEPGEELTEGLGCTIMVARVDNAEETFGNFVGTTVGVDLNYVEPVNTEVEMVRELGNTGFPRLDSAQPDTIQNACAENGG